jgi:hypothetical protein
LKCSAIDESGIRTHAPSNQIAHHIQVDHSREWRSLVWRLRPLGDLATQIDGDGDGGDTRRGLVRLNISKTSILGCGEIADVPRREGDITTILLLRA